MKTTTVRLPLFDYLAQGGILKENDTLYLLNKDVYYVDTVRNEHNDLLISYKTREGNNEIPAAVFHFMISVEIVLKENVKDVVTRAYNMGAFSGNAMSRTLHKEIECLTLPEFLAKENL